VSLDAGRLSAEKDKKKSSGRLKWLLLAIVLMIALPAGCIGVLVWRFTPLIEVDESGRRLGLLGGAFKMDFSQGAVTVLGKTQKVELPHQKLEGKAKLRAGGSTEVVVHLRQGAIEITNSPDVLRWSCETVGPNAPPRLRQTEKTWQLDLTALFVQSCRIEIPRRARLRLTTGMGQITLVQPKFAVNLKIDQGQVRIRPDEKTKYTKTVEVSQGEDRSGDLASGKAGDAVALMIKLGSGTVERF